MCGIGGWFSWGKARPNADLIKSLMLANQTRGSDAAGLAYLHEDGVIRYIKDKGPAAGLIARITDERWSQIASSPRGIIHARAKTKGSENDNVNNHPVIGCNWMVVHNGHVSNDDDLFEYYKDKTPRFAEVDTAAIPLVLGSEANYMDSLRKLTVLGGNITAAMWNLQEPDKIALVRFGHNDLYLYYDVWDDIVYWSSAAIVGKRMPAIGLASLRFIPRATLEDNRVMILQPDPKNPAKMFELARRPFTQPVRPKQSHGTGMSTGGGKGATISRLPISPNFSREARYSYERLDAKDFPGKPSFSVSHKLLRWDHCSMAAIRAHMATAGKGTYTVPVAYGRWLFNSDDGEIIRRFKQHKMYKRFLHKTFGHEVKLPVELGESMESKYDGRMLYESLIITEPIGQMGGAVLQVAGVVCPFCGAWTRMTQLQALHDRCPFCLVKSKV